MKTDEANVDATAGSLELKAKGRPEEVDTGHVFAKNSSGNAGPTNRNKSFTMMALAAVVAIVLVVVLSVTLTREKDDKSDDVEVPVALDFSTGTNNSCSDGGSLPIVAQS